MKALHKIQVQRPGRTVEYTGTIIERDGEGIVLQSKGMTFPIDWDDILEITDENGKKIDTENIQQRQLNPRCKGSSCGLYLNW